jgi:integrase
MIVILAELEKPETHMEWTLAVLHASTALRPEESFGLKWSDIDWESGQIHIRRGWSKGKETDGKNAGSMSQVPMHPVLAQCLQDWRQDTPDRIDLCAGLPPPRSHQSWRYYEGLQRQIWMAQLPP